MDSVIENRRRPRKDRVLRHSFGDQVPPVIEAYAATLIAQAIEMTDENETDSIVEKIKRKFAVHHVAARETFEELFLKKRACPAEVKIDWTTERVYLVGIGLPEREELSVQKDPIKDRHGDTQAYGKRTLGTQADDTVLCYTEVSWRDLKGAEERAEKMSPQVKQGLQKFFQMPPHQMQAALLALESYTDDQIKSIAHYAAQQSR